MRLYQILAAMVLSLLIACSCTHGKDLAPGYDVRRTAISVVSIDQNYFGDILTPLSDGGMQVEVNGGFDGRVGTGVVIATEGGESLVISVAHVTDNPGVVASPDAVPPSILRISKTSLTVTTLEGKDCPATQIYADEKKDLSILKVSCAAGIPMRHTGILPPFGAEVIVVGAALGLHPDGIFIPVDGRYVGETKYGQTVTAPVAPGHSGSPVVYDGKLIGVVKTHKIGYEHLSFFIPMSDIYPALDEARKKWHAK